MPWLDKIRNQSHESKVRLIWICAGVVAVLMLIAWIIIGQQHFDTNTPSVIENVRRENTTNALPVPEIFNTNNTNSN